MPTTARERASRRRLRAGFTLIEILIAVTIGAFLMLGVLTTFLMMGRSGASAVNYVTMEQQARVALERFGEDVRMAQYLTTVSASQIKLTVPHTADNGTDIVYYTYDSSAKTFSRLGNDPVTNAANTTTVLIRDVSNCEFKRWMLGSSGPASGDSSTDQLQIRLTINKATTTVVTATNLVVSARYVLRNHKSNTTSS